MQRLKHQILQITLFSFIWLLVICTLIEGNTRIELFYVWKLLAISGIIGGVFGFVYPYTWEYLTWSALVNSIVMTGVNFVAGYVSLYLFSATLFSFILPYWWAVLLVTFVLHLCMYQLYRRYENQKIARQLNRLND